jgi:hypothetical protein
MAFEAWITSHTRCLNVHGYATPASQHFARYRKGAQRSQPQ